MGPRSSALVGGYSTLHRRLELELARLKGTQDCLLFPTGELAGWGPVGLPGLLSQLHLVPGMSAAGAAGPGLFTTAGAAGSSAGPDAASVALQAELQSLRKHKEWADSRIGDLIRWVELLLQVL